MNSIEELTALLAQATPGPYRAHDHNDMARLGEDPEKWLGYAWVGRVTKYSEPDGRFDAGWLDRDSRNDGSKEYRERASVDAHFVAAALNALPDLLAKAERVAELEEALTEARCLITPLVTQGEDHIWRPANDACSVISAALQPIEEEKP